MTRTFSKNYPSYFSITKNTLATHSWFYLKILILIPKDYPGGTSIPSSTTSIICSWLLFILKAYQLCPSFLCKYLTIWSYPITILYSYDRITSLTSVSIINEPLKINNNIRKLECKDQITKDLLYKRIEKILTDAKESKID